MLFYAFLGYTLNACDKKEEKSQVNQVEQYKAKTISFTDDDILEIARLHNVYLVDMLNAHISDKAELVNYLVNNFTEFQNQSTDSLKQMIDYLTHVTQEDIITTITNHSDKFDHPKLMVSYLNQAYTFLDNFDDTILQNLETQARTHLSQKECKCFIYISA